MYKKNYRSIASYEKLKHVERLIDKAIYAKDIRNIMRKYCPKIGYKPVGYLITGYGNPERMKGMLSRDKK